MASTQTLAPPTEDDRSPVPTPPAPTPTRRSKHTWNRFSIWQLAVMALAAVPVAIITGSIGAAAAGLITTEAMIELALAAGENPGMITFGAMFLASPIQWFTGRSQVRVRKFLGIVFYLLAISNGAMFMIESGVSEMLSEPLLVAGTAALAIGLPLFLTSSRWSQRLLGMARWRLLHKLTYVLAIALVSHVVLVGDIGLGFVLITLGVIARTPPVRRMLQRQGANR